jgi:4-amino-4-deoxy-L-arabinose transferase-like glycosyltransferase
LWKDFVGDQLTDNLDQAHVSNVRTALFLLGATLQHFLPWTILLLVSAIPGSRQIAAFWRQYRKECLFTLGWYGLLVAIFCMSNKARGRYLLPAYPLIAVILSGMLLAALRDSTAARIQRWTGAVLLAVCGAAGIGLIVLGGAIDRDLVWAGAVLLAVSGALLVSMARMSDRGMLLAVGVAFFSVLAVNSGLVRPVFMAAPEEAMARELLQRGSQGEAIATVDLPPHAASHLGLWSAGRLTSIPQRPGVTWSELARFPVILFSDAARGRWTFDGYRITQAGYEYPDWSGSDFWALVASPNKRDFMVGRRRLYFIASREDRL